ncbi:MAG: hypothetical protein QOG45_2057, partial [Chloroflexota bacterium]|nr:hypothetical protein [Chloroflexota bacterium]
MALDAFVNAVLPAGDPICFGLESGAWAAIGTAVLDAKSALDAAVQQASAGWTGDAATAFESWWQTRSQPMQALGAACDTLAGLLGATVAAVTAADVGWVAAAASVATDAPEIGAAGPESFAGGPAAVAGFIQGCFAPLIAAAAALLQPEIVAALEAEALVCQAAATGVVVAVETTIASTAAAAITVAGLAAGLATALVVDPGKLVPQATTGQTLVSVGIPVATGTIAVGLKAGSTVLAYREAAAAARAAGSTSSSTGMMQAASPAQIQDIVGQTRIGQVARRVAPAVDALKGASGHAGTAADVASLAWAGGHLAASK